MLDYTLEKSKNVGTKKNRDEENKLSDFDASKNEILEEFKKNSYYDMEDMVNRVQLTYNGIMYVLDKKYSHPKRTGYTLPPGIYQLTDIKTTLKYILPNIVKVNVTIDDFRLKSSLKINQTLTFTKRSFVLTILGFTQSPSRPLGDIDGFIQLVPGTHKCDGPDNITAFDKVHLKCDCICGSIVKDRREPILSSFGLSSPPGLKLYNQTKVQPFKKGKNNLFFLI